MLAPEDDSADAAHRRVEVSLDLSRHLARVDVAAASFSSGSGSSGSSDAGDSTDSSGGNEVGNTGSADVGQPLGEAKAIPAQAPAQAPAETAAGSSSRGGGTESGGSVGEYFAEPEWQRVPGRWSKFEEKLLKEMKADLQEDLRAAPQFPEVVGSRRMLRFLRGHRHDPKKAAAMMRQMLQWRKANGVDAIREDILQNQKFHPSRFPDGEMITRLFPLLVANPLCVDMDGAPVSYESYEFSPRQVTAHANGDLGFFIKFHIYCQEFKQICLDGLSDAKEMENLARRAASRAASPPPRPLSSAASPRPSNSNDGSSSGGGQPPSRKGAKKGVKKGSNGRSPPTSPSAAASAAAAAAAGGEREDDRQRHSSAGVSDETEGGVEGGEEEEPWGVVLRNTIIRDLSGFGVEHAGKIGRELISQVLAVSQDNYPEMMERCYIINAPWVFYALWKGLTPLVSASTAKKVQVLKYDFLSALCETISLERLPTSAGGGCDPTRVSADQMHDFVVCGRVAEVSSDDEGSGTGSGRGGGADEDSVAGTPAVGQGEDGALPDEVLSERQKEGEEAAAGGGTPAGGGSRRGSSRRGSGTSSSGGGGGVGGGGKSGGKPHVTFRSLLERLQARDEPRVAAAVGRLRRSRSPPLSRASSFQENSSLVSPPLSRHGSNASLMSGGGGSDHGGGGGGSSSRRRQDGRSSPGRPFASPGPRGIRRALTVGIGGLDTANGDHSPGHGGVGDDQAEDFDSRLVGRALRLSMKRKAQRFKAPDAVVGEEGVFDDVDGGSGDGSASPLSADRSPREQEQEKEKEEKGGGGWAKKKWRALKERRESKKMLEKGFLADLPGLSAGDCAEWIPNSARNSCLHCERPFTLLLRRHHCRMCGELVCGQCSPHRVRLAEDEKETASGGGGGGDGTQSPSHPRHGNGHGNNGGSRRSRHARKERDGGRPKAVAVRVCTDCHFSLQTVTVASASAVKGYRSSGATSGGGGGGGGDDGENAIDDQSLLRRIGTGDGENNTRTRGLLPGRSGLDPARGGVGVGVGLGGSGVGLGFVRSLEAVYSTDEIAGDVVLGDVLEWSRIERRAYKCLEVVRMCLLVVVEMHHNKLLEVGLRLWRASRGALSVAATHASTALAASGSPSSSSGDSSGGDGSSGGNPAATGSAASLSSPAATTSASAAVVPGAPTSGCGGEGSSLRQGSSSPSAPPAFATAAGTALPEDADARSSEAVVARAEAAMWAAVDKAASHHSLAWVLLVALLPLMYRLLL